MLRQFDIGNEKGEPLTLRHIGDDMSENLQSILDDLDTDPALKARMTEAAKKGMLDEIQRVKAERAGVQPKPAEDPTAGLTEEEKQEYASAPGQALERIKQKRVEANQAAMTVEYKKEMYAHQGKPWELRRIKERYRGMDLLVDRVVF